MPVINCKVELKLKWTNNSVLEILMEILTALFYSQRHKIICPCCHFSAKNTQKLSKVLRKVFERSVYWKEYKTKSENKNTTNEYRYFLDSNFVGVIRLFVLVYLNRNNDVYCLKVLYTKRHQQELQNLINGKNFYDQPIHSDLKRREEIQKLTTRQDEDYTPKSLLDYEYIKNHHKIIAVDLRRQRELDANPKSIHQIDSIGKLQNDGGENVNGTQSMFVLTILNKEARLKFSQRSVTVL